MTIPPALPDSYQGPANPQRPINNANLAVATVRFSRRHKYPHLKVILNCSLLGRTRGSVRAICIAKSGPTPKSGLFTDRQPVEFHLFSSFRRVHPSHRRRSSPSSITITPSFSAFASLLPDASPATKKAVCLLTLPATLPPAASMRAAAS